MDSSMRKMTRKLSLAMVVIAALVLAVGMPGQASAATCAAVGGIEAAGNCTINTALTAPCPFDLTVPGDLLITGTGSITCNDVPGPNASPITISVGGDMEMQAGSAIRAENVNSGGSGGNITLTVGGDFTMRGPGGALGGAVISSSKISGAGDTGAAGDIRIKVGNVTVNPDDLTITCAPTPSGDILMENGAQILANASGEAGAIKMFAGKNATINGLVSSEGTTELGRGGPITIDACCDLVIGDTGKVISKGLDAGADLVHLQACTVEIFGLVASTGPGHKALGANLCNVNRPGKPAGSSACIEIWAGTTLVIDSTNGHKGEVNADTATGGGTQGGSWVDALANLAITIRGNATAPVPGSDHNNDTNPPYAVHANQILQNGHGGDITVISKSSTVTMFGRALQANASTISNGGKGGHIVILALNEVAFGTGVLPAFVQAAGDTSGGGSQQGGTVLAQSFSNNVTGIAASQINVEGPGGVANLKGCLANPSGTYLGAVIPAAAEIDTQVCPGGSPTFPDPAAATLATLANCSARCGALPAGNKNGVKFLDTNQNGKQDLGEPGLPGWTIHLFDTVTHALLQSTVTAAANVGPPPTPDGFYSFFSLGNGNYTVCEALQAGWTQTAPGVLPPPVGETVVDCAPFAAANPGLTLGPKGYSFTIAANEVFAGNDFGNFMAGVCPEDPLRASKITRVVDETGTAHGPAPVYLKVQDAYNAAAAAGEVIGLFSKTTENVVLNGAKAVTITQCTNARVFALDPNLPVWTISSSKPLLIIGPDAVGGKVGWQINTGGHELKGLRANGASLYGIQVIGSNNKVAWNSVSGNGGAANSAGIRVESTGNDLRGGTVSGNTGDGVQIVGGTNSFQGATVENNTGNGVSITGTNNTIKSSKANNNGGAGYLTTATATGNKFQSNASNTSSNGSKENTGPEYNFGAPQVDQGSNKADNVTIPTAAKCPTLFSAGGICE
jgi:hypothetical protein